jgi:Tol biopolymer transport system component
MIAGSIRCISTSSRRRFTGFATLALTGWFALAALQIATLAQEQPEPGQSTPARFPGRIYLTSQRTGSERLPKDERLERGVVALDPNDATWRKVVDEEPAQSPLARVSPDGRLLALSRTSPQDVDPGLWIFKTSGEKESVRISEKLGLPCWSPDGRSVFLTVLVRGEASEYWRVAADGSHEERLAIPAQGVIYDGTPHGPWLLTRRGRVRDQTLSLMRPDGGEERQLLASSDVEAEWQLGGSPPRFSPDGRHMLTCQHSFGAPAIIDGVPRGRSYARAGLLMLDVDGGRPRRVFERGEDGVFIEALWSPDGRTIAVVDSARDDDAPDSKLHWQIELVDTQGNVLRKFRLPEPLRQAVRMVDWR